MAAARKKKRVTKKKARAKTSETVDNTRAPAQLHEVAARWVHISTLTAWGANPRDNDAAVEPVAQSIKRFGWGAPILAREANSEVVAGHTRLRAVALLVTWAKKATDVGLDHWHPEALRSAREGMVPVRFGAWSERDAHLLALADNRLNEVADWDVPALNDLLGDYAPPDIEAAGWTQADLDELAAAVGGGGQGDGGGEPPEEPPTPEPPKDPITKLGDVWVLGEHRLVCGDCREAAPLAFGAERAQLVYTDPPYGVDYDGGLKVREKLAGDEGTSLFVPACELARDYSDDKAALYLWHAGVKGLAAAAAAAAAGWQIRCELVWNKNNHASPSSQYMQKHEPAYYCHKKGKSPRWFGPNNEVTVWDIDRAHVNEFHPTQKPVEMAARAIRNSSEEGDIVADFFLGSGATMMAAEQLGRRCYGTELSPAYCDVIVERWEQMTGGKAKLESSDA